MVARLPTPRGRVGDPPLPKGQRTARMERNVQQLTVPAATPIATKLAIETHGLRKTYGEKTVVHDVTIEVPEGEVFGFLGPNGAGKSTTMKMLLGLAFPTAGGRRGKAFLRNRLRCFEPCPIFTNSATNHRLRL